MNAAGFCQSDHRLGYLLHRGRLLPANTNTNTGTNAGTNAYTNASSNTNTNSDCQSDHRLGYILQWRICFLQILISISTYKYTYRYKCSYKYKFKYKYRLSKRPQAWILSILARLLPAYVHSCNVISFYSGQRLKQKCL